VFNTPYGEEEQMRARLGVRGTLRAAMIAICGTALVAATLGQLAGSEQLFAGDSASPVGRTATELALQAFEFRHVVAYSRPTTDGVLTVKVVATDTVTLDPAGVFRLLSSLKGATNGAVPVRVVTRQPLPDAGVVVRQYDWNPTSTPARMSWGVLKAHEFQCVEMTGTQASNVPGGARALLYPDVPDSWVSAVSESSEPVPEELRARLGSVRTAPRKVAFLELGPGQIAQVLLGGFKERVSLIGGRERPEADYGVCLVE